MRTLRQGTPGAFLALSLLAVVVPGAASGFPAALVDGRQEVGEPEPGNSPHVADGRREIGDPAPEVDAIFAEYDRSSSPGCALGVIRGGELVYLRGYGMANLEHGVPITGRSVFRIGSTSKQFTALATVLLQQDGVLSLDDPVRRWVPDLHRFDPPITIRQLLHHTSGLRDYLTLTTLAGYRDEDHYTDDDLLRMLARQRHLNFEPGERFLYSNSGYWLLSRIVERASGRSLRRFAAERIFEPLGMGQTHFHDDHAEIVPHRATGYAPREEGGFRISVTRLEMVGDGGVFTSVRDLLKWDRNFYDHDVGDDEAWNAMLTPGTLADGEELDYALGLRVDSYRGVRSISHGGSFVGYRAEMLRLPEERFSVITLCNVSSAQPSELARRVADVYLGDLFPEPPPEDGEDEDAADEEQEDQEQEDQEDEEREDQEDGNAEGAREGGPGTGPSPAELRRYAGAYYSDELDVTYRFEVVDGGLRLVEPVTLSTGLRFAGTHRFETTDDSPIDTVEFVPGDGEPDTLRIEAGRVRGFRLRRLE